MNYTSNMGMNMPDENDKFSIEHFNTNTQALDIVGKPDEYKNTKTYAVGDLCIHNNILYKCIIAVETAEEFNAEKWEVTSLCKEEIANKTAIAELNEKIPNPVLLWENPDPTQRFPVDGTIELSSGDYEWLEIYYCSNTTSNGLLYQKVKKGDIPILIHTHFTSSGSGFGYRALQYIDDTHLKGTGYSIRQYFSNNVTPQFDNKATAYGIPVKIYGIK